MCFYVYADHAQYTIKTYAKMSLFALARSNRAALFSPQDYSSARRVKFHETQNRANADEILSKLDSRIQVDLPTSYSRIISGSEDDGDGGVRDFLGRGSGRPAA